MTDFSETSIPVIGFVVQLDVNNIKPRHYIIVRRFINITVIACGYLWFQAVISQARQLEVSYLPNIVIHRST